MDHSALESQNFGSLFKGIKSSVKHIFGRGNETAIQPQPSPVMNDQPLIQPNVTPVSVGSSGQPVSPRLTLDLARSATASEGLPRYADLPPRYPDVLPDYTEVRNTTLVGRSADYAEDALYPETNDYISEVGSSRASLSDLMTEMQAFITPLHAAPDIADTYFLASPESLPSALRRYQEIMESAMNHDSSDSEIEGVHNL